MRKWATLGMLLIALLAPSLALAQSAVRICVPSYNSQGQMSCADAANGGFIITAANSNATVIKALPGILFGVTVTTTSAVVDTLRFYDSASGVLCGATPKLTYRIPASATGSVLNNPIPDSGIAFTAGIIATISTGSAITDCGNAQAGHEVSYSYQ